MLFCSRRIRRENKTKIIMFQRILTTILATVLIVIGAVLVSAQPVVPDVSPRTLDKELESARNVQRNKAQRLTNVAIRFARINEPERQLETWNEAVQAARSEKTPQNRAKALTDIVRLFLIANLLDDDTTPGDPNKQPAAIDVEPFKPSLREAFGGIKEISGDKEVMRERHFLLRNLEHIMGMANMPEDILLLADAYTPPKEVGLPDWDDFAKENGDTYGGKSARDEAVQRAALLYVRAGELDKAKKLVIDKMRPQDAADALRYFPDILVPQGNRNEAAAVLVEAATLTTKIEGSENYRGNVLGQIIFTMNRHGFFDEALAAVELAPDKWKRVFRDQVAGSMKATPGVHAVDAPRKIMETTSKESESWWQAATTAAIQQHEKDQTALALELTQLLTDALDTGKKQEVAEADKPTQEKQPDAGDYMAAMFGNVENDPLAARYRFAYTVIGTATMSKQADAVLAALTLDDKEAARHLQVVALTLDMLVGFETSNEEAFRTKIQTYPKRFDRFDLNSTGERMFVGYLAGFLNDIDPAALKEWLDTTVEQSAEKIEAPKEKDRFFTLLVSIRCQAGLIDEALATAKRIRDVELQGTSLATIPDAWYRLLPQSQWPKEIIPGSISYDSSKMYSNPNEKDVRKTIEAVLEYVAKTEDVSRRRMLAETITKILVRRHVSAPGAVPIEQPSAFPIFKEMMMSSDLLDTETKAVCVEVFEHRP